MLESPEDHNVDVEVPVEALGLDGDREPTPAELAALEADSGISDYSDRDFLESGSGLDSLMVYLHQIGRVPLLTREQEYDLAVRMRDGDPRLPAPPYHRIKKIRKRSRKAYFAQQRAIMAQARSHFIQANLRLVVHVVKRYRGHGTPLLDLIQQGNLGLMRAVEKFDPDMGNKFSTYAVWWIKQRVFRAIANEEKPIRIPAHSQQAYLTMVRIIAKLTQELKGCDPSPQDVASEMKMTVAAVGDVVRRHKLTQTVSLSTPVSDDGDTTLQDLFVKDGQISPESMIISQDIAQQVRVMLARFLTSREVKVISMRFGIGDRPPMTLEEIGSVFSLTRERIRQIEAKIFFKLREGWSRISF